MSNVANIHPEEDKPLSLCSWNLVQFEIQTPEAKLVFDRQTAEEIYRCLADFLEVPPRAG